MRRARWGSAAWIIAGGAVYVQAFAGCELVAGVGSLGDRTGDGGQDSTTGDGSGSSSSAESGSTGGSSSGGSGSASSSSSSSGGVDAGSSGGSDGGGCTLSATLCSGNGVQTCGANGQWGTAVACSGTTPFCASGACTSTPPSCQTSGAGRTTCPAGTGGESCCTSLAVAGGTYNRTYTNTGTGATGLADPATVSGFRLDKYLVTVGRFRQFVSAWSGGSGYTPPAGSGKHTHLNGGSGLNATGGGYEPGWVTSDNSNIAPTSTNLVNCGNSSADTYATWTNTAGSNENLPINCVNWWESYAFCIWDGGFLPSEADWEYAAAGGSQQREYPWGTTAPGTANQYAIYGCYYPSGSGSCSGVTNIAPVGTATLGAGLWGQLDLAGNMWEWNLDWYATYATCTDCANFTAASSRVVRGDYFYFTASYLLPPYRDFYTPTYRGGGIGLRCSRTP